ncbi:Rrf2 family transcriptional regulator [Muricoccus radiodurans]|uniref:Rrf2 family transcriptional regulator n=1 Tax=Muricoccus radiodurans TaxID=2231721 RepID=UPI003CF3B395
MRLSTRSRYAVMALAEMAGRRNSAGPVTLADIAEAQMLSAAYLEQLFMRLRRGGLVESARGPGGGYRLARMPSAISVAEIVEAVDEPISATRCEGGTENCLGGRKCPTHDLWAELGEQIRLFLSAITLADVVEGRTLGRAMPVPPAAIAAE